MHRALPHLRVLPATRAECVDGARPCPLVSCRYHLLLEVGADGRILKSHDFDEHDAGSIVDALVGMDETCALDARRNAPGGLTVERVAKLVGQEQRNVWDVQEAAQRRIRDAGLDWDEREHPEDPYLRYMAMDGDELAEAVDEVKKRNG